MSGEDRGLADELALWLHDERTRAAGRSPLFWSPTGFPSRADWQPVTGTERLAVLISTACHRDNNVCLVSGEPGRDETRSVNVIGLVGRPHLGWALILKDPSGSGRDVSRAGSVGDGYASFSAYTAALIAETWVRHGVIIDGLQTKSRDG